MTTRTTVDGRRARGDRSRRAILTRAVDLASVDGLEGLTIGRLAAETATSKSGIATLFGAKEQLQLAVVEAAREIYVASVVEPARAEPRGIRRVVALVEAWVRYSQGRVFAGGCFFFAASLEFDSKPGEVRDAISRALGDWNGYLSASVRFAIEAGELPGLADAEQLAFEIDAILDHANARSLLLDTAEPYRRARRAVADRLLALGADPDVVAPLAATGG